MLLASVPASYIVSGGGQLHHNFVPEAMGYSRCALLGDGAHAAGFLPDLRLAESVTFLNESGQYDDASGSESPFR